MAKNNFIYPKLFKLTKAGSIQVWWAEQSDNKYRTHSGKLDGAIVTSAWTTCHGKNLSKANATTGPSQASNEVQAHYDKKRKSGYADNVQSAQETVVFKPMLAHKYQDYADKLPDGVTYLQPKLDGTRCIGTQTQLLSRQNRVLTQPHILSAIASFFEWFPGAYLDGELYNHEFSNDFNSLRSLTADSDNTRASELLQYHIYDAFFPNEPDLTTAARRERLLNWYIESTPASCIQLVPTYSFNSVTAERIRQHLDAFLEQGYEGLMVRTEAAYETGRSQRLLKFKDDQDEEFTVLSIHEGKGNREGMAGYAIVDVDGKQCRANIKGNREFLSTLLSQAEELVGTDVTVQFFQRTPDGMLRFPRITKFWYGKRTT